MLGHAAHIFKEVLIRIQRKTGVCSGKDFFDSCVVLIGEHAYFS
jgi:hypothetical protein